MSRSTPLFQLADAHVQRVAEVHPFYATYLGEETGDGLMPDFSPAGHEAMHTVLRETRAALGPLAPTDDADRRCRDLMAERLDAALAEADQGEWMRALGVFTGAGSQVRSIFDVMRRDSAEAWENIAARLAAVPTALTQIRATLDHGRAQRTTSTQRQAEASAAQADRWVADRWFDSLVAEARRAEQGDTLVARLQAGADAAHAAYADYVRYLRDDYGPSVTDVDACGAQRYRTQTRVMAGADLDPAEMYAWGWEEFERQRVEIAAVCNEIKPGASFPEVVELLETDPARCKHSADEYRDWLQAVTDTALARSREHFDIPAEIDRCDVRIPPQGSAAAAYYMPPSEDFTRPGSTWYPLLGRASHPMWSEVSTAYHESVPGHHLQIATALYQREQLSRFQRNEFISGHGEGWALYAEQLADELGWFDTPDYRLGFLAGQQMRAVRVIVDIGMHLRLPIPNGVRLSDGTPFGEGQRWDAATALAFATVETGNTTEYMASEIDRYLSWPAQAITYKIGQREWLRARDETKARLGARFDLRQFHTYALNLGCVGLDQLRAELAHFQPA